MTLCGILYRAMRGPFLQHVGGFARKTLVVLCEPRPEVAEISRKETDDLRDLAWLDPFPHDRENGSYGTLGVLGKKRRHLNSNVVEKLLPIVLPGRRTRHVPAFVEQPAQQHRKLRTQVNCVFGTNAIAKGMEGGAENDISRMTVVRIENIHHALQPDIRLLKRLVEGGKTGGGHDGAPMFPAHTSLDSVQ